MKEIILKYAVAILIGIIIGMGAGQNQIVQRPIQQVITALKIFKQGEPTMAKKKKIKKAVKKAKKKMVHKKKVKGKKKAK